MNLVFKRSQRGRLHTLLKVDALTTRMEIACDLLISTAASAAYALRVTPEFQEERSEYAYKLESIYRILVCILEDPDVKRYVVGSMRLSEIWTHEPWLIPETEEQLIELCLVTAPFDPSSLDALLHLVEESEKQQAERTRQLATEASINYLAEVDCSVVDSIDPKDRFCHLFQHWQDRLGENKSFALKGVLCQIGTQLELR